MNGIDPKLAAAALALIGCLPSPALARDYAVPGTVALATAARHGWTHEARNSIVGSAGRCELAGARIRAGPGALCWITLFLPPRDDCRDLRVGWRLKEIRLRGEGYEWDRRPQLAREPQARIRLDRTRSAMAVEVVVDQVVLEGPDGPGTSFEDALSHCRGGLAQTDTAEAEAIKREHASLLAEITSAKRALSRAGAPAEITRVAAAVGRSADRFTATLTAMSNDQMMALFLKLQVRDPADTQRARDAVLRQARALRELALELATTRQEQDQADEDAAESYADKVGQLIEAAEEVAEAIMSLFGF